MAIGDVWQYEPQSALHIYKDGDPVYLQIGNGYSGYGLNSGFKIGVSNTSGMFAELRQVEEAPMLFFTDDTERMRILGNNGYVGIGTPSPANLLTVTGGNIDISSQSYSYMFSNLPVLQTRGYSSNILVGINAGINIAGDQKKTVVGYEAGSSTTSGEHNTYVGYSSGLYNTTGKWNTYLGYLSGISNATGYGNTMVGYKSGHENSTNFNTFLGYHSGYNTDVGAYNLFLGTLAGFSNEDGELNTMIGYNAQPTGSFAASLDNASAIGANATATDDNTMVLGSIAGKNSASDFTNVLIGTTDDIDARLNVHRPTTNTSERPIGIYVHHTDIGETEAIGIFSGIASESNTVKSGEFVAVKGIEVNIGVKGYAWDGEGEQYGGYFSVGSEEIAVNYGIYAESPNDYAGYFNGDVFVNGTLYQTSDSTLKSNINPLTDARSLLGQLRGTSYTFNTQQYPHMYLPSGPQYGIVAQELEGVFPHLVRTTTQPAMRDSAGNIIHQAVDFKSVNYVGLIPFMLEAMNDMDDELAAKDADLDALRNEMAGMNNRLAQLEQLLNQCCGGSGSMKQQDNNGGNPTFQGFHSEVELGHTESIILDQNQPNPFKEQTVITFQVPEGYSDVRIIFFEQGGRVLREVPVSGRGNGSLQVYASDLSSGIYHYSLVADGKTIATKQMVKVR